MRRIAALAMCLVLAGSLWAEDVRTTVKYVSAGTAYLDAGRAAGIAAGDSAEIFRGGEQVAFLSVTFVADNSASCALSDLAVPVLVGDSALVRATGQAVEKEQTRPETISETEDVEEPKSRARNEPPGDINRLTGRIGMDYLIQDDREEFNYDYSEPSLSVRASLSNIKNSHISAALRMRLRKTYRDRESSSATTTQTSQRIYEAALRYADPASRMELGVGRMIARELRGIGYIDGGFARYRLSDVSSAGAFAGTEPDLENTDFQTDVTKGGVFTAYEKPQGRRARLSATLSLAGTYHQGEVDREFLYQQVNYSLGSRLRLFESTEINIYRDWLKEKQDKTLDLASVLLNARYAPGKVLAFSLGYDNRKSFYTYDSRSVPDSLFDDALRQGWRGSVEARLARTLSTEVGGGLRTMSEGRRDTRTGWFLVRMSDILSSGVHANARVRVYSGEYSEGAQPSITLSRSILRDLNASAQAGANNYTLRSATERIKQNWLRLTLDVSLGRHLSGNLDAEAARGSNRNVNTFSLGLGYRL